MKDKIYILFTQRGIRSLIKRTTAMRSLPSGTYIAELNLEVDDKFFDNQIPKFNIKLEGEQIAEPEVEIKEQELTPLGLFFSRMENDNY